MRFSMEQSGDDKYLLYQFEQTDVIETMSFGQITNNHIPGLAPAAFTQMDAAKTILYKITSQVTLDEYLKKPVRKAELLKILSGILSAASSAQEYMIEPKVLIFDKKYTFLNPNTLDVSLVCLPVMNREELRGELQSYLWELAAKTTKDKSESREYAFDLMEKLDSEESLSLGDMERILKAFEPEPAPVVIRQEAEPRKQETAPVEIPVRKQPEKRQKPVAEPREPVRKAPEVPVLTGNETMIEDIHLPLHNPVPEASKRPENLTVIDDANWNQFVEQQKKKPVKPQNKPVTGNETVLEMQQEEDIPLGTKVNPCLVREQSKEVVRIQGKIFQIGSDYEYCDYQVVKNRTVANIHAQIIKRGNDFYIKDMNSKFKTFLDERPIPCMEEIKLRHGMKVRLGTERFVFTLH